MKLARVFATHAGVFVQQMAKTKDAGFHVPCGRVFTLGTDCGVVELGTVCSEALEGAERSVPDPPPNKKLTGPLLRAAKAKTWGSFARDASLCSLRMARGEVAVVPMRLVRHVA